MKKPGSDSIDSRWQRHNQATTIIISKDSLKTKKRCTTHTTNIITNTPPKKTTKEKGCGSKALKCEQRKNVNEEKIKKLFIMLSCQNHVGL